MTEHPAKFSPPILEVIKTLLEEEAKRNGTGRLRVLDPFAGTGLIHTLQTYSIETTGVEIEPEWAALSPYTVCGDALSLNPLWTNRFDVIATSPTYGNRMADHHNAKDDSKRITYKHKLGRDLHPNNSGQMSWGPKYQEFHRLAWAEAVRVLRPGGLFILNIKDFYRTRTVKKTRVTELVEVGKWHVDCLLSHGFWVEQEIPVRTRHMRMGANATKRASHEMVYALRSSF